MRKLSYFMLGSVVTAVVMMTTSVYADDIKQLVNAKVGSVWQLYVDGESVGDVPIIQGSSYAPVRQIAEIAGFEVGFEDGKVFLETKEVEQVDEPRTVEFIEDRIQLLKERIESDEVGIQARERLIVQEDNEESTAFHRAEIEKSEERIAAQRKEIAELEAELAALESVE